MDFPDNMCALMSPHTRKPLAQWHGLKPLVASATVFERLPSLAITLFRHASRHRLLVLCYSLEPAHNQARPYLGGLGYSS